MASRPVGIGSVGRVVARRISELRQARDISQRDLAQRLARIGHPMLASAISKIETGDRRVDVDDLVALADVLDAQPASLLEPPACAACTDAPPPGFQCTTCGAKS